MMPMHFPYGNLHTVGQQFYEPAVYRNLGFNCNPYFASFDSNSNGLLPTPGLIERNKNSNCKSLVIRQPLMNSFSLISAEDKKEIDSNDFLTFIEQKSKLNPFANEFSFGKKDNQQMITTNNETISEYKLLFNDLIEKSLQSMDAIKKSAKTVSVNHVSVQYDQSIDQINRSTQTNDDNQKQDLLQEYSSRTIKLIDSLLENFKYLLLISNENDLHNQLKCIGHICDELRHLTLFINQIISSNKSSVDADNPFSNMIKDLSFQSSPIMFGIGGRTRRLISSSISYSPTPSFSLRLIDPITMVRSKICLLCQKPVDKSDDIMHELCRLLSSPSDVSIDMKA